MRYLADAVVWYQYGGGGAATEVQRGDWLTLQVGRFTPGGKAPGTPQLEDGWAPEPMWEVW